MTVRQRTQRKSLGAVTHRRTCVQRATCRSAVDQGASAVLESISITLVLLLAVVLSGLASRLLPLSIPTPLVQIMFGWMIASLTGLRVELDPEIFFLLFVPPLLFLDGWRVQKEQMLKDRAVILNLALGLVVFTVIGVGYFVHWMIPALPLAIAFALAAVLSPTDPIAVSAIAARVPIPKRMRHILEGESLLNDATGLVCFRFATAAALTGTFSPQAAALNFLWVALGGVFIGVAITWATARAKDWVTRKVGEESGSQIIISLLIPFAAYLLAESLHCSGILAAVSAGVTMSVVEASGQALPITRLGRHSVWDTVQFAANGIIFVLLGEQLPGILAAADETVLLTGRAESWWLLIYIAAIYSGLVALRFGWVWVSLSLTVLGAKFSSWEAQRPNWRLVAAASLAGVRGAITLAAVLTLPLSLSDGAAFPGRDLAIVLAMGVIITSLLVASIGLPFLLRGLDVPNVPSHDAEDNRARVIASEAAIAEIERLQNALPADHQSVDAHGVAAKLITEFYRSRIEARSLQGETAVLARENEALEKGMRIAAVKAERVAILQLLKKREIGSETARKLVRELDLLETRYES